VAEGVQGATSTAQPIMHAPYRAPEDGGAPQYCSTVPELSTGEEVGERPEKEGIPPQIAGRGGAAQTINTVPARGVWTAGAASCIQSVQAAGWFKR
jgi:hypothetical protein